MKLYNKAHNQEVGLREAQFSDPYRPSTSQKQGEIIYVVAGTLTIGLDVSHFGESMEKNSQELMIAPKSFWKGLSKFKKFTKEARVSEDFGKLWLMKQAIWQIDLRTPKHIPRPTFHV